MDKSSFRLQGSMVTCSLWRTLRPLLLGVLILIASVMAKQVWAEEGSDLSELTKILKGEVVEWHTGYDYIRVDQERRVMADIGGERYYISVSPTESGCLTNITMVAVGELTMQLFVGQIIAGPVEDSWIVCRDDEQVWVRAPSALDVLGRSI